MSRWRIFHPDGSVTYCSLVESYLGEWIEMTHVTREWLFFLKTTEVA